MAESTIWSWYQMYVESLCWWWFQIRSHFSCCHGFLGCWTIPLYLSSTLPIYNLPRSFSARFVAKVKYPIKLAFEQWSVPVNIFFCKRSSWFLAAYLYYYSNRHSIPVLWREKKDCTVRFTMMFSEQSRLPFFTRVPKSAVIRGRLWRQGHSSPVRYVFKGNKIDNLHTNAVT